MRRIRVALDAMGGDHGVEATMAGAARLSLEDTDIDVVAVGEVAAMSACLTRLSYDPRRLVLQAATGCVPMDASPREALAAMPGCSVATAVRLVAEGEADALVSAGSTGAFVLSCARAFKLLPGIPRAALASVYPTATRHGPHSDPFALMLDVGATVTADADALVGFALMGSAYSSIVSEITAPRVALLSNGSEASKGTPAIVEAHARLQRGPVNFVGNVEGVDIPRGTVDVVVCDGFLGNVVLKMLEGVGDLVRVWAEHTSSQGLRQRLGMQMIDGGLDDLRRLTDWKAYGGAPLLGMDRLGIKAHGRSEAGAVRNALKVAAKAVRGDLHGRIATGLAALPGARA